MPTLHQMENMQHVSRSGRPYPNIVHNVQSPALKVDPPAIYKISRIGRHSRQSIVSNPFVSTNGGKQNHLCESEEITGYVASRLLSKRLYAVSTPPMLPKGAHRPGLLTLSHRHISVQDVPTCELSVLFEIILPQALKQTGPPCIENSCEFPISGNCGQPREYFLVAP